MTDSNNTLSHAEGQGIGQGRVDALTEEPGCSDERGVDPTQGGEHFEQQMYGDTSLGDIPFHRQDNNDIGLEKRRGEKERSECEYAQDSGPKVGSKPGSPVRVETSRCDLGYCAREAVMGAGASLMSGDYTGCLLALEAARQLPGICTSDVERLSLICRIHINSEAHAWRKVSQSRVA